MSLPNLTKPKYNANLINTKNSIKEVERKDHHYNFVNIILIATKEESVIDSQNNSQSENKLSRNKKNKNDLIEHDFRARPKEMTDELYDGSIIIY